MPSTRHNAEEKSRTIVLAAKKLFLTRGYGVTSMDTVAREAGVTKQTLYRYYPSKEALFGAVILQIRESDLEPYEFSSGPLHEELYHFGIRFLAFHLHPETLGLYRLMITEGSRNRALYKTFQSSGPRRFLEPLIRFLNKRCPKLDQTEFTANMFCSMILTARNNVLIGRASKMSKEDQQQHVKQVVAFVLRAIQP